MGIKFLENWLYDDGIILNNVDPFNLTVMDENQQKSSKKCPLCCVSYTEEKNGNLCAICLTCEIGKVTLGKKIME